MQDGVGGNEEGGEKARQQPRRQPAGTVFGCPAAPQQDGRQHHAIDHGEREAGGEREGQTHRRNGDGPARSERGELHGQGAQQQAERQAVAAGGRQVVHHQRVACH